MSTHASQYRLCVSQANSVDPGRETPQIVVNICGLNSIANSTGSVQSLHFEDVVLAIIPIFINILGTIEAVSTPEFIQ